MQEDKKEGIVLSLLHIGNMYPICKNVTSFHKNFDFRKISVWTFTKNEVMLYEWSTRNFWLYAFWRSNQGCPAYRWRNGWKHVVVKIYGCRLVIVLFDGYNIMVRWVVRYVWIYGSTGKRKNRTYHFGGYGGYLKKSDWGRNKHLSDMAHSERCAKACWYLKKSRNLTTFWLLSIILF